jgi:hypothetical protein
VEVPRDNGILGGKLIGVSTIDERAPIVRMPARKDIARLRGSQYAISGAWHFEKMDQAGLIRKA